MNYVSLFVDILSYFLHDIKLSDCHGRNTIICNFLLTFCFFYALCNYVYTFFSVFFFIRYQDHFCRRTVTHSAGLTTRIRQNIRVFLSLIFQPMIFSEQTSDQKLDKDWSFGCNLKFWYFRMD